jgi:maleylacetoacetate isomerase
MKLYSFFRSSASYRVRIALNLKGVAYDYVPVNLVRDGGEHNKAPYLAVNPAGRVPALELDDGTVLTQSLAIIDYLEVTHPEPSIYPKNPVERAKAMAVALTVVADIHPVNNVKVVNRIRSKYGQDQAAIDDWSSHWIRDAFATIETLVEGERYCFGDRPSVADLCLVPQVFNARRFQIPIETDYPRIAAIDAYLTTLPAFKNAHPAAQPDAE